MQRPGKITNVFFDFDGTLADTERYYLAFTRRGFASASEPSAVPIRLTSSSSVTDRKSVV